MENEIKSEKTSKKINLNLILFIIFVILGLGLVILGFIIDKNERGDLKFGYDPAWYIYLLEISGAVIFLLSFGYLRAYLQEKYNIRKMNVNQMSVISIFGAL